MARSSKLTEAQERERASWQFRCIQATRGNSTRMGCIMLAVLNKPAKHPPAFGPSCVITEGGIVLSNFIDRHGKMHVGAPVADVEDLIGNFRGLADMLQLSDEDREALFAELRRWVSVDYRADGQYDEIRRNIQ